MTQRDVVATPPRLIAHPPGCYGCGSLNDHSLGVRVNVLSTRFAVFTHTAKAWAQGGLGFVHGGYLSTVADEAMATAAAAWLGRPVMTYRLETTFHRAIHLDRAFLGEMKLEKTGPRRAIVKLEARCGDEPISFRATGSFFAVPERVFVDAGQSTGRGPDQQDWSGGDLASFVDSQIRDVLPEVFDRSKMARALRVRLCLPDVDDNRSWIVEASRGGLCLGRPGIGPDATLTTSFRCWQQLIHHGRTLTEAVDSRDAELSGSHEAVTALIDAISFGSSQDD